jgi:hypothetical protein
VSIESPVSERRTVAALLALTVLRLSLTGLAAGGRRRGRPARHRAASGLAVPAGAAAGAGLLQAPTSAVIAVASRVDRGRCPLCSDAQGAVTVPAQAPRRDLPETAPTLVRVSRPDRGAQS